MTERCDLSDLPVEQCACRIHGPKEERAAPPSIFAFPAGYPGPCTECENRIHVGDLIVSTMEGYAHEECP